MYSKSLICRYYLHIYLEGEYLVLHSFCIKTNNNCILDSLLYDFENSNIDELYISERKFKIYKNVILHYHGEDVSSFYAYIAGSLTNIIINFYENYILKSILVSNYFYFSDLERKQILDYCSELLNVSQKDLIYRKHTVFSACLDYAKQNKYLILDGFIHFRLKDYWHSLEEIVDMAVDKFVLEREYNEFISLLKLYIDSKEASTPLLHLIYNDNESILLDSDKHCIDTSSHIFDAKYLSDISFSSNDYALNALLNLLPEKLYIHLVDNTEDEFITTLKLIFGGRVIICTDCPICHIYRLPHKQSHKMTTTD